MFSSPTSDVGPIFRLFITPSDLEMTQSNARMDVNSSESVIRVPLNRGVIAPCDYCGRIVDRVKRSPICRFIAGGLDRVDGRATNGCFIES